MNGSYVPLFANPLMRVELDLDLEKLSEFAFQLQDKEKEGVQETNIGGWQSGDIIEEKHEEFIRLKKNWLWRVCSQKANKDDVRVTKYSGLKLGAYKRLKN